MFLKQFVLEGLGHASYLLGSEETGEALVLDPQRRVDDYLAAARDKDLRIRYGIDTHGHNDYLSGLAELTAREKVTVLGSATGNLGYAHQAIRDGEVIEMGEVGIEVLHTPGHTPEHVSLLVYDRSTSDEPALLLSGGALLVGDLARPDLLGSREDSERSAKDFCRTLQEKILTLPDHVEVFPTHVAGSLCGANIGSRLSTTVGYERRSNPVLVRLETSEDAVDDCISLENLPAVPPYWKRMRNQNLAGVPLLGVLGEPSALQADIFARRQDDGAVVLDTRSPEAFGAAHIPGALNVGLGTSFATWAGTVLPADTSALLVLERPEDLWEATWHLLRIGYPLPAGWLAGGMPAWRTAAKPISCIEQISVHELDSRIATGDISVLDVRQPAEWAEGHIPDATFITGAELPARLEDVPDAPLTATVCASGYRSSVAASVLAAEGRSVINVLGGMTAWQTAGYPTERCS